jgi:Domain of unknown function (DUF1877)
MACLGAHFAISSEAAARLKHGSLTNADIEAFIEYLGGIHADLRAKGWVVWTEKAWDGIHRCLTDGKLEIGNTPGHLCILGATERFWLRREDRELEYIINLLEPSEVRRVADAIRRIDRAEMRRGYDNIDPDSFYRLSAWSEDDFEYTWDYFQRLQVFFQRAADAGRWVVFRVDQ